MSEEGDTANDPIEGASYEAWSSDEVLPPDDPPVVVPFAHVVRERPRRRVRQRDETMTALTFFLGMLTAFVQFGVVCGLGGRAAWPALISVVALGAICLAAHRSRPYGAGILAAMALIYLILAGFLGPALQPQAPSH